MLPLHVRAKSAGNLPAFFACRFYRVEEYITVSVEMMAFFAYVTES